MWNAPAYYYPRLYYPSYDAYQGHQRSSSQSPSRLVTSLSFRPPFPPAPQHQHAPSFRMAPGVTWIERGSDGRPYFVKKKSKLPSARELLSEAIAPLRKGSSPFSRSFRREHHIAPAPMNTPLYLPAPPIPPALITLPAQQQNHQPALGSNTRAIEATQYSGHKHSSRESDSDNPRSILKSQPQNYPVPHPTMYPAPPQQVQPLHPSGFGALPQNQVPNHMQHIPTQPPGAFPNHPLPPGARIISPPRFPTAEELKYKCSICGRFRSARYHYKHPLLPGQLPGMTVCRKCQEQVTDSEGSAASWDDSNNQRHRHRRSRSCSRLGYAHVTRRRSKNRRGRSLSRTDWSEDEYEDNVDKSRYSHSRSSSLNAEPLQSRSNRPRSRRPRSPRVAIVRYIERLPRPQLTRRVSYVQDENPRHRQNEYELDEEDEGYEYRPSHRIRGLSRPPTPAPRVIRRQCLDPTMPTPLAIEHHGYIARRDSSRDGYGPVVRSPSRSAYRRSRVTSARDPRRQIEKYTSESDDGFYDETRRDTYRRPSSLMDPGRSASGSRSESRVYGRGVGHRSGSRVLRAPNPPGWNEGSEPAGMEITTSRMSLDECSEVPRSRRSSRTRSGSRAPSAEDSQRASTFLRAGDEVSVIERHEQGPEVDYDWYDRNGMRVRVREI